MNSRIKEIAVIMLIANITFKLGNNLTKNVNDFRRKLRKYLNKLQKHEKRLYEQCITESSFAWNEAYNSRSENLPNLSVASTLDSLNLLIEDVKWIKKIYTQKQFMLVYASIINDKDGPLTAEVEQASKVFTDDLAKALGFKKPNQLKLKRMIYTLKQNKIIEGK